MMTDCNYYDKLIIKSISAQLWKHSGLIWSVHSTQDGTVEVQALAGDIVLCSWARHFITSHTFSASLHPEVSMGTREFNAVSIIL